MQKKNYPCKWCTVMHGYGRETLNHISIVLFLRYIKDYLYMILQHDLCYISTHCFHLTKINKPLKKYRQPRHKTEEKRKG